jgi:hypothetical protein
LFGRKLDGEEKIKRMLPLHLGEDNHTGIVFSSAAGKKVKPSEILCRNGNPANTDSIFMAMNRFLSWFTRGSGKQKMPGRELETKG